RGCCSLVGPCVRAAAGLGRRRSRRRPRSRSRRARKDQERTVRPAPPGVRSVRDGPQEPRPPLRTRPHAEGEPDRGMDLRGRARGRPRVRNVDARSCERNPGDPGRGLRPPLAEGQVRDRTSRRFARRVDRRGRRDDVFIVSKVYPQNATPERMRKACERSLKRLGTERIDLYLLHWRGDVALRRMLDGFAQLLADEKIAYAGVSNFDVQDMDELARLKDGLDIIVANEVLYNLEKRGIEYDLLPWMRKRHRPVIAYSPIEEGLLAGGTHRALASIAERHDATAAQVSLAWVVRDGGVIAIPKAGVRRVFRPYAGKAIRLKLDAHGLTVGSGARALVLKEPELVLNVMAVLVRDHVALRERPALRAELRHEVVEEADVEIDLPIVRAIKRTHRLGRRPAGRRSGVAEQDRPR